MVRFWGWSAASLLSSSGAEAFGSLDADSRFSFMLPMRSSWRLKMFLRFCVPFLPETRCVAHLMRFVGADRSGSSTPASSCCGNTAIIGVVRMDGWPGGQRIVSCGETGPREARGPGSSKGCYVRTTGIGRRQVRSKEATVMARVKRESIGRWVWCSVLAK